MSWAPRPGPRLESERKTLDLGTYRALVKALLTSGLAGRIAMYESAGADWVPILTSDLVIIGQGSVLVAESRPNNEILRWVRPSESVNTRRFPTLDIAKGPYLHRGVDLREPERRRLDEWYTFSAERRGPYRLRRVYRGAGLSTLHPYLAI